MTYANNNTDVNAAVVDVVTTVQQVANRLKRGPDDATIKTLVQNLEASASKLNMLMQKSAGVAAA